MNGDNPDRSRKDLGSTAKERRFARLRRENKRLRKLLLDLISAIDEAVEADDLLLFFQSLSIREAREFFAEEKRLRRQAEAQSFFGYS